MVGGETLAFFERIRRTPQPQCLRICVCERVYRPPARMAIQRTSAEAQRQSSPRSSPPLGLYVRTGRGTRPQLAMLGERVVAFRHVSRRRVLRRFLPRCRTLPTTSSSTGSPLLARGHMVPLPGRGSRSGDTSRAYFPNEKTPEAAGLSGRACPPFPRAGFSRNSLVSLPSVRVSAGSHESLGRSWGI